MRTSPHHLILVREIDEQMSGSGCCGRIEGDLARWDRSGCVFPERRALMGGMGALYRAVRERFDERVEITIIDPRNQISLVPLVIRDGVRYRLPLRDILRSLASASLSTGILDGRLLFARSIPATDEVLHEIEARIGPPAADAFPAHSEAW
jgi:hypothetical protein